MDYMQFKKELLAEMRAVLKPHGFAKYSNCFRCARPNGIACMVEVQSSRFGDQLTINAYLGVLPAPVTAESWKGFLHGNAQWSGGLGQSLEDGWAGQYWVRPHDKEDPRVVDGCITMRWKQEDGPWQEMKIPVPTSELAKAQVCGLLRDKLLPLFDTLQTPEDYVRFCKTAKTLGWHGGLPSPDACRFCAQAMDVNELLFQIDECVQFHSKAQDSLYKERQELEQTVAQSWLKKPNKWQRTAMNNYESFIQRRERLLAEYEQLRRELMAASSQKE